MMKKKGLITIVMSAVFTLALFSMGASAEEAEAENSAETEDSASSEEFVHSYLTGELVPYSIGRTRPIAVMFNNIQDALPQSGISNADVVYEAPVEGNITRLMGLMEDYQDVERIGSVRSCREYYVYFAREFDAIYLHYGHAVYATHILNDPGTLRLSGMGDYDMIYDGEGEIVYYRSDDFASPHNVFTDYDRIQEGIEFKEYDMDYPADYTGHYQFAEDGTRVTLEEGESASTVAPGYSYNQPYFIYDESSGTYTRYQFGAEQIDMLTGSALCYDNIIFQFCPWEKWDDNGYLDIDVYSGGTGKFITNGRAIDVTWSKEGVDTDTVAETETGEDADGEEAVAQSDFPPETFGVTHYYDADGNEITLNQGKTWVCIILDTEADSITISE